MWSFQTASHAAVLFEELYEKNRGSGVWLDEFYEKCSGRSLSKGHPACKYAAELGLDYFPLRRESQVPPELGEPLATICSYDDLEASTKSDNNYEQPILKRETMTETKAYDRNSATKDSNMVCRAEVIPIEVLNPGQLQLEMDVADRAKNILKKKEMKQV